MTVQLQNKISLFSIIIVLTFLLLVYMQFSELGLHAGLTVKWIILYLTSTFPTSTVTNICPLKCEWGEGRFYGEGHRQPPPHTHTYIYIYSPSNLYIKYNIYNKLAQCSVLSRVNYKSETISVWYCNQRFAEVPDTSVGLHAVRGGPWHRGWALWHILSGVGGWLFPSECPTCDIIWLLSF